MEKRYINKLFKLSDDAKEIIDFQDLVKQEFNIDYINYDDIHGNRHYKYCKYHENVFNK